LFNPIFNDQLLLFQRNLSQMLFLNFGKRAKNLLKHPCPAIGLQLTVASRRGSENAARYAGETYLIYDNPQQRMKKRRP
jgi:hypothetical protein